MTIKKRIAVIRADGGDSMGMGHIMRCIGLAQQLRSESIGVIFALGVFSRPVVDRLKFDNFDHRILGNGIATQKDVDATIDLCREVGASLIVVDGYAFSGQWLKQLKVGRPSQLLMLWTDYLQSEFLPVDIILDQTPYANSSVYKVACPKGEILCGLKYSVLRTEFRCNPNIRKERKEIKNVLVTMGGADPTHATLKVIKALDNLFAAIEIRVVVGPANKNYDDILAFSEFKDFKIYRSVTDMSELLGWADIAISAAGTSLWECAYSGLPVITTFVAENQFLLAKAVDDFNCGINLGDEKNVSADDVLRALSHIIDHPELLSLMSRNMLSRIDGDGVVRLVDRIQVLLRNE
jgi:UDP-2,4-diacetamido-2,4,6-trideoxy-beta-L-altropyranose hydrolase